MPKTLIRKSDGLEFPDWLSNVARSSLWIRKMRTPAKWRELYDQNMTYEEAAQCKH